MRRRRHQNEADFTRWLRRIALGVSVAPLGFTACGRTESSEFSVIPNASIIVAQRDAGVDAGVVNRDGGCGRQEAVIQAPDCVGPVLTADCVSHEPPTIGPRQDAGVCPECDNLVTGCTHAATGQTICWQFCAIGRLTDGIEMRGCGEGVLGREFANMASLEAGAALAFSQLARELDRHGVSPQLARRARRAAREEVRHAQLVGGLARAHGGQFEVTAPIDTGRTLEALAQENATEGCVRETLGALIGLHQSQHASDATVRAVLAEVSRDELGHAAWSHELAHQLDGRLSLAARRRVREARAEALLAAAHELSAAPSRAIDATLGLPDGERINTMAVALT